MPEEIQNKNLEQRVAELEAILLQITFSDRFTFSKDLEFLDGRNIKLKTRTGTKIGGATQKLGLWGVTPVIQQSAISAPSGGATQDAEARTAINSIRTALTTTGITA
mgnify:CR=1 FL=1